MCEPYKLLQIINKYHSLLEQNLNHKLMIIEKNIETVNRLQKENYELRETLYRERRFYNQYITDLENEYIKYCNVTIT